MDLYIVRHGPAGSAAEYEGPDADRPLTDRGVSVVERVAEALAALDLKVGAIVTSPYVRAEQTARLIARALKLTDRFEVDARLAAGFGTADLMSLLADYSEVRELMIVGHEPDLSHAIGELTGIRRLKFKKGAVALVAIPDPRAASGQLQWIAPPAVLTAGDAVLE